MNQKMEGKVAIVTGGAQGIGRCFAAALAKAGVYVCVADVLNTEQTVSEIYEAGGTAIGCTVDVTDQKSVDEMVKRACTDLGDVSLLVNNAALFSSLRMRPFEELDAAEWDRVMAVNVRGPWQTAKAVLEPMKRNGGGSIINVASATVFKGSPFIAHYVASKGAVVALTRSLARELAAHDIRINAIAPGLVVSEGVAQHSDWKGASNAIVASRAIQRDSQPEDLVGALLYLASDQSSFVTGQTLVVDGGSVMH